MQDTGKVQARYGKMRDTGKISIPDTGKLHALYAGYWQGRRKQGGRAERAAALPPPPSFWS